MGCVIMYGRYGNNDKFDIPNGYVENVMSKEELDNFVAEVSRPVSVEEMISMFGAVLVKECV